MIESRFAMTESIWFGFLGGRCIRKGTGFLGLAKGGFELPELFRRSDSFFETSAN